MMMNLLQETIKTLGNNGKTIADVQWVGTRECSISWAEFEALADVEYDEGYGGANVAEDLVVVGDNWWLERHEYDGSEWWEYKTLPVRPICEKPLSREDVVIAD